MVVIKMSWENVLKFENNSILTIEGSRDIELDGGGTGWKNVDIQDPVIDVELSFMVESNYIRVDIESVTLSGDEMDKIEIELDNVELNKNNPDPSLYPKSGYFSIGLTPSASVSQKDDGTYYVDLWF